MFKYTMILLLMAGGLLACKKDKVPTPAEPTKWEKIEGAYKVFDTTGVYLYEMSIEHIIANNQYGGQIDSLRFNNFNGEFNFTSVQSDYANFPELYISIGVHYPVLDTSGNRWKIFSPTNANFNYLEGDTVIMKFYKDNIMYYIEDLTPYFHNDYKQIAVKQ